jgi:hypothetical protein
MDCCVFETTRNPKPRRRRILLWTPHNWLRRTSQSLTASKVVLYLFLITDSSVRANPLSHQREPVAAEHFRAVATAKALAPLTS